MKLNAKRTISVLKKASRESKKALRRHQGCLFLYEYGKNEWERRQIELIMASSEKINIETINGRTFLTWIVDTNDEPKLAQIELK